MKVLGFILSFWLSLSNPNVTHADESIVFIANRKNPVNSISLRDVIDYYRKEKRQWPSGLAVRFIDRNPGSPERKGFISKILKQSASDVDLYWFGQKLHSGDSMPIQVLSDSMMMEMVGSFDGAIGYISSTTPLKGDRVKQIRISDMPAD